jgi:hypothetical protein
MRKVLVVSLCLLFVLSSFALARNNSQTDPANKQIRIETSGLIDLDLPLDRQGLHATAQADTYILGEWSFDGTTGGCEDQGWTHVDRTLQDDIYWHITNFDGLFGGDYGRLVPITGLKSLWCGARPDPNSLILCGYAALPGYGNDWDQNWVMRCIEVPDSEEVYLEYVTTFDSEPGYDGTYVEYATKPTCDSLGHIDSIAASAWVNLNYFDGMGIDSLVIDTIPAGHEGSIKIRFRFSSDGAWSDYDGLWDTDGAFIVDDITVSSNRFGGNIIDIEDFEGEAEGAQSTTDGDWWAEVLTGYGDFAGLYPGLSLVQEDPCRLEVSCVWAFIVNSTETYACGGFPGQLAVPKSNERGQFISNEIWSPVFDYAGQGFGSVAQLVWDVYRDLPLDNLMFYVWHVRSWIDDCPYGWRDRNFVYYGGNKDWFRGIQNVGDLMETGVDSAQVALGVVDMAVYWYFVYGSGACHSHSPLLDNVLFRRINTSGPQWSVRDIDLFNDDFSTDGTITGTGRVDMALDVAPQPSVPTVYPGDSATVTCSDPVAGLVEPETHTGFGAAVYCYFSISPPNQADKKTPAQLEADNFRWPMVDSVNCDGKMWYKFRCDTAFTEPSGPRTGPVPDRFCIDFNDNVLEPGDTLEFFFRADGGTHTTFWSQGSGTVTDINEACAAPMEMQILPGAGYLRGGDILYVDGMSGRGAQPYFDSAMQMNGIYDLVDRFDVRGPTSAVSNRPGRRVKNIVNQLCNVYMKILWNTGDINITLGDGTGVPEKSDDWQLLLTYANSYTDPNGCGIYLNGDDLAEVWASYTGAGAVGFMGTYLPHTLTSGNHEVLQGISPLCVGEDGGMFDEGTPFEEDSLIAYGGCPIINDFDVVTPVPASITNLEMTYNGTGLPADGAIISAISPNPGGHPVRVVLSGFSFHYIRDDVPGGVPDRADHLNDIIEFLGNELFDPTPVKPAESYVYELRQNYPNPFNPSTRIEYRIKERGHVTLKIYNVAGQLVKTLVNEQQNPRVEAYTVRWRGRSDAGTPVSSGVYFYKLVANNFTQTKKMVLLK